MNLISLIVAMLICVPALVMASRRSSWLIDYLIVVVAFNRGIRRMVDYSNGYFDQYSLISLTPLIVGALAALVVILRLQQSSGFGAKTRRVLNLYLAACAMAFAVGLIYNRFGAVYALGDFLAPVGLLGFGAWYAKSPNVMRRWGVSLAVTGVAVSIYGIYQYYTIPPWDAFWVRAAKLEGYLGILESTKMTLFSTMASRGPAAMFLAGSLIVILLRPRLLSVFRWPAALLVATAMLLTYSRTTVIHVALACGGLPIVTKGRGLGILVTIAIVLALFGESLLGFLPNQKVVADRYSTIGNIQDDGSFKGRVMLLGIAIRKTATAPLGYGIGSGGLASRVSGSQGGEVADSTGYLQIMTTFGWIGGTMIFAVLLQLWKSSSYVWRNNPKDPDAALFRAWFVSGMVVLFSGNWLAGVSYFWLLAGYVIGQEDLVRAKKRKKRRTKKGRSVRDRDDGELDQSSEASPGRMPVEGSTPNVSLDS